jgi:penicillin-binding protein 2
MGNRNKSRIYQLLVFSGFGLIFFCVLIWRLVDVQILQGNTFRDLADANRLFTEVEPVERGVLLDRFGEPLVFNQPNYYLLVDPDALYSPKQPLDREEALQQIATGSGTVKYELDRSYRYPLSLAHVTGYIGEASLEELEADNRLDIGQLVGKMGLEKHYDEVLRGKPAARIYEVNALGKKQRQVGEQVGQNGLDIQTTLDPYLSEVALAAMGSQRGAVVILDADTGQVLSLVSSPSFNTTLLSTKFLDAEAERQRRQEVSGFFTHPQKLFFNRAVSGAYPPGSVFKLVTALAGLDEGAIDAQKTVVDEGVLKVGDYSYANWYFTQYGGMEGAISLQRAIARSNDIYFYKAAEWTGPTAVADMARLLGLGKPTGIELAGEARGLVPDPAWKERELGEKWFLGNTYHMGIGQGNLLVSPLQTAQLIQTIAKEGTQCKPSLVKDDPLVPAGEKTGCTELGLNSEAVELVLKGMLDACSSGGTGFPFFAYNEKFRLPDKGAQEEIQNGAVACKTGTSEFGGVDSRGYKSTHGWFAAVAGVKANELAAEAAALGLLESSHEEVEEATASAETALSPEETPSDEAASEKRNSGLNKNLEALRREWLARVAKLGYPQQLVLVALVESDETNPYKEGSRDAGPVVKQILDWIHGEVSEAPTDGQGD